MNTTSAMLLNHEQRGTLAYSMCGMVCYAQGWFYLNGSQVVMRKVGGRNRFNLCAESVVHDFTPYDAEAEKFAREFKALVARTKNQ